MEKTPHPFVEFARSVRNFAGRVFAIVFAVTLATFAFGTEKTRWDCEGSYTESSAIGAETRPEKATLDIERFRLPWALIVDNEGSARLELHHEAEFLSFYEADYNGDLSVMLRDPSTGRSAHLRLMSGMVNVSAGPGMWRFEGQCRTRSS